MELDQTPRPVPVRDSGAMAVACEHMYPGRPGRARAGGGAAQDVSHVTSP